MNIKLDPQEKRFIELLATGMSIEQISVRLNDPDVETTGIHYTRLLKKFRTDHNPTLIRRAISFGLVPEITGLNPGPDNEMIREILNLPHRHPELVKTQKLRELLSKTGYPKVSLYLDEFVIEYFLEMYPEYIVLWREWKRKSPGEGWFYRIERSNVFTVGSIVEGRPQPMFVYAREAKACAVFIKRELERIRTL